MNTTTIALILTLILSAAPTVAAAVCSEEKAADTTPASSETAPANPPVPEDVIVKGKDIFYTSTCVACHGENGKGKLPGVPDLTAPDNPLVTKSEEELTKNVKSGFRSPGSTMAMPPKGGDASLGEEEIRAVLKFMKKQFAGR